jgi:cholesterol oxidase
MAYDYDVLVIGSGFGGSVSALRLTEKGYRVGVLEAGRRFEDKDLPKTSWRTKDFLWAPGLKCKGIQRIHLLRDVVILAGAGVGGGSLNYAQTLYVPPEPFFADPQWKHITDWRAELSPFYDQAQRMLGVVENPTVTPADEVMMKVAERLGVGDTYRPTPVGVFFGRDGRREPGVDVDDPYFGGAGPRRSGCIECGECLTGCRHGAKNTLLKNYLYLAEKGGAVIHADTTVSRVRPLTDGGYAIDTTRSGTWVAKSRRTFTAEQVVVAAGTYGTQKLLHQMKATGQLPNLSSRLGLLTRTNSESIMSGIANGKDTDFTRGVAITSSIHPSPDTHIEPVRYGKGSNAMGLLQTHLTEGGQKMPRWLQCLAITGRHPLRTRKLIPRRWSERTVILLVMQSLDNSITVKSKRGVTGRRTLTSTKGHGAPNPTWIPVANEAAKLVAEEIGGMPAGTIGELVNIPMTAHFIGGCAIGDSRETGVIDAYHRAYGHPGLHIVDGSAISANLGVNPSLTITAQAERAIALWPNHGQPDPRPELGAPYKRVNYIAPTNPAVPQAAPGALRLPVVTMTRQQTS